MSNTIKENMIVCPYCNEEIEPDSSQWREIDADEETCPQCANTFLVSCMPVFEFSTTIDCITNGLKHEFTTDPNKIYLAGKKLPQGNGKKDLIYHCCLKCEHSEYK